MASSSSSQEEDLFDTLPDPILLLIFSKLSHAKSLSQCLIVCKRFASLIHQTNTIFLPAIPQKITSQTPKYLFKLLLRKLIPKSNTKTSNNNNISYHSPVYLLKDFNSIKSLDIQVPCLDPKMKSTRRNRKNNNPDSLLKWKADFGSEFKSCVVLATNEFQKLCRHGEEVNFGGNHQNLSDEELRVRIIQTISCLISVSVRHCLLKQVVEEHESVENVSVSDAEKQGVHSLAKHEIAEMRDSMVMMKESAMEAVVVRSRVSDLTMKLWYACIEAV